MHTDPIADLLTRIRNGGNARIRKVECRYTKINEKILNILLEKGYVKNYKVVTQSPSVKMLNVFLKYEANKHVITEIKRISTPGLRKYSGSKEIPKIYSGFGITILTTSKGIVSGDQAKKLGIGGEILCSVF